MIIGSQTAKVMKTSRKQILQSGVEKSMSSPEVFPASLFLAPDSERERKMTATSGRKCYERYGRFSPIGLLVKTLLESSQWYNPAVKLRWDVKNLCSERLTEKEYCIGRNTSSKQCVTTLNVKDISSNRLLFRLVPSERRTEETVSSLLPTVQTQGLKVCNENGKTTFYPVGLLPTPRAVEVVEHPMKAAARTKDRTGTNYQIAEIHLGDVESSNILCEEIARRWNEHEEWHECKEDTEDVPPIGTYCILRVEYLCCSNKWKVDYLTAYYNKYGWTEDYLDQITCNYKDYKITHWKPINKPKGVEE